MSAVGLPPRVRACYAVFVLLLVVGALVYASGLVLWLALPRGQPQGQGRGRASAAPETFLGLSRGSWEDLHVASALLLLALTVVHVALNWGWIVGVTRCLLSGRPASRALSAPAETARSSQATGGAPSGHPPPARI